MKRKLVQLLIGTAMTAAVAGAQMPVMAEETAVQTEAAETVAAEEATEAATEAAEIETETETESETEDDFIEGSALLEDCGYEAGKIDEEGWESKFLNMKFVPEKGMKMALSENEQLGEYYGRHGEDKHVANSEMVAKDGDDGYLQMTVEVNPNEEEAEDILARFAELEELELVSKAKETEVAGKIFKTCTGIFEREKYMIGVCTDMDDVAIAFKIKYKDTDARKALLNCFEELEPEEEETETETETEEASEAIEETEKVGVKLVTPSEFEDEELIGETEAVETDFLMN